MQWELLHIVSDNVEIAITEKSPTLIGMSVLKRLNITQSNGQMLLSKWIIPLLGANASIAGYEKPEIARACRTAFTNAPATHGEGIAAPASSKSTTNKSADDWEER